MATPVVPGSERDRKDKKETANNAEAASSSQQPSLPVTINNEPVILMHPMDVTHLPVNSNNNKIEVDKARDYFIKVVSLQSDEVALIPVAELVVTVNNKFRPIIKNEGTYFEMISDSKPVKIVHSLKVLKRELYLNQASWYTCSSYAELFAKAKSVHITFRDNQVVSISQSYLREFPFQLQHLLLRNAHQSLHRDTLSTRLACTFSIFQEYLYFNTYKDFGFHLDDNQLIELAELAALTDHLKMQVRCLEKFYNNSFPHHLCNHNVSNLPTVFIHIIWNFLSKKISFDDDMNQLANSLKEIKTK